MSVRLYHQICYLPSIVLTIVLRTWISIELKWDRNSSADSLCTSRTVAKEEDEEFHEKKRSTFMYRLSLTNTI